jgi:D-lactate dehydrogenase
MMAFAHMGIRLVALRSAGFNNVDVQAAASHGIIVARVPAYSPHAVAEHAFALLLALDRKVHRAYNRVREGNFSLEGLMGFDLFGKTIGIVGAGKIGSVVARIAIGFGCTVLASDPVRNPDCEGLGVRYVPLDDLLRLSDVVTLHCPLNESSHHLIGATALALMKQGAILINTSRGAVVDTHAVIGALKGDSSAASALTYTKRRTRCFSKTGRTGRSWTTSSRACSRFPTCSLLATRGSSPPRR